MLRRAGALPLFDLLKGARHMALLAKAPPLTADLCDVHVPDAVDVTVDRDVQILEAGRFRDFGGVTTFCGPAVTIRCFENNPLVRAALEEPGQGRVLVVDGGGSMRCALLGDQIAKTGVDNGWSGVIVHGCIRDSVEVGKMAIGVKALGTHPLKSSKRDPGLRDVPVAFGGVVIKSGNWVYADADGVLIASKELVM